MVFIISDFEYLLYTRDEIMLLDVPVSGSIANAIKAVGLDNFQQIGLPLLDSGGREVGTQVVWLTTTLLARFQAANTWPTVRQDRHERKTVHVPGNLVSRVYGSVSVVRY